MLFEKLKYLDERGQIQGPAYILIQDGKIKSISETPPPNYSGERVAGEDHLLLPGLANAHCHVAMTLLRGYGEGLPLDRWLQEKVFPFEALLTDEDAYWGTLLGIAELLASGCVSFTDMYMNLGGIIPAVEESGIKANLSHGCAAPVGDPHFCETNAYTGSQLLLEHTAAQPSTLIRTELALHAEYTSNPHTAETLLEFAKAHDLAIQVHVSETQKEHEEAKARRGGRTPLRYLYDLGYFEVPLILAHCIYLEESDYELLSNRPVTAPRLTLVHNPSSNLKLASGFAPLKRWQACPGVNIALGTDGASSNNNLNMWEEVYLASLLQKAVSQDASFLGPEEALSLASRGGFLAQGRENSGVIKEGADADLIMLRLDDYATTPCYNALANLLYAGDKQNIVLTMVNGRILYHDGEFLSLDIERIKYEVRRIAKEKSAALA